MIKTDLVRLFGVVLLVTLLSFKSSALGPGPVFSGGSGSGNEQDKPPVSQEKTAAQQFKNIQVFKDLAASQLIGPCNSWRLPWGWVVSIAT